MYILQAYFVYILQAEIHAYGTDWNGPVPLDDDVESVEVVHTVNPLNEEDYQELQESIDPSQFSLNHGIDLYLATLHFVSQRCYCN